MKTITLKINCSETHCHEKDSVMNCHFRGNRKFGTIPVCRLFPSKEDSFTDLDEDNNSRVLRCSDCLNS